MQKKILCIDDEEFNRNLLRDYLGIFGYQIITAVDGEEGLQKAAEEIPDLIILDILMPKKNGYAVLKELKSNPKMWNIPVIIMTVQVDMQDMCELEGAVRFIKKPVSLKELRDSVRSILNAGDEGVPDSSLPE